MPRHTVLVLLAGRAGYRAALYGAGFVLVGVWGTGTFARYAAAVGLAGWLFSLLAAGVERAALLGVGAPGGDRFEALYVGIGAVPFGLALLAWLVLLAVVPGSTAATLAAAAALATGGGLATVLAALYRMRRRPYVDAAAFATLSAAYVVVVALAAFAGLGVDGLLATLVVVVCVIDLAMIAALRLGVTPFGARDVRAALRTAVALCAGEVLALVAIAVLYAELGSEPARQTSIFYLANIVTSILIGIWPYLLRLGQARISSWVSRDAAVARERLRRLVLVIAAPGVAFSVAGVAAVFVVGENPVLIGAALVAQMLIMAAVAFAAFVVESIDTRTRETSAVGAVVGFTVIAAAGALLIPAGGAAGALVALCIGWTARCPLLIVATRKRVDVAVLDPTGVSTPTPAVRP